MDDVQMRQSHMIHFLTKSHAEGRLVHAYLFFGGSHLEKIAAAKYLAKLVLGRDEITSHLVDREEHANVITIRPEGKQIKKEQIIFLKKEISKKSIENKAKIYLIDGADKMSASATNSLLKFLEEPAPDSHIILISPSKEVLLPTITSRTVNLNFKRSPALEFEADSEVINVIRQLELVNIPPQMVTAKNPAIFKDHLLDFLRAYQVYYRDVLDLVLGIGNEGSFDQEMLAQSVRRHDIKSCIQKLRAIERATRHLQANMNVGLCVDQLWMDSGEVKK